MTEWERFKAAAQAVFAVPPETAAAIRRGEISAPAEGEAVRPGRKRGWRRRASARESARARVAGRKSGASRKSP